MKPEPTTLDTAIEAACIPLALFMLQAAAGDPLAARAIIAEMIRAYKPADMVELDLISRIVGFGLAAMDNIRMSMADPGMKDAMVLRCRAAAASLSRSAEQCRVALDKRRVASSGQPLPAAKKPAAKSDRADPADDEKADAHATVMLNHMDQLRREWAATPVPGTFQHAAINPPTTTQTPADFGTSDLGVMNRRPANIGSTDLEPADLETVDLGAANRQPADLAPATFGAANPKPATFNPAIPMS